MRLQRCTSSLAAASRRVTGNVATGSFLQRHRLEYHPPPAGEAVKRARSGGRLDGRRDALQGAEGSTESGELVTQPACCLSGYLGLR